MEMGELELRAEVVRLRSAIRKHMNERGDDRCYISDAELYAVLPEGDTRPERDTAVTLENCERYIRCRQQGKEYVSLEREIERLQQANADLEQRLAESERLRVAPAVAEVILKPSWEDQQKEIAKLTTNERHLHNLLSWRSKENADLKQELAIARQKHEDTVQALLDRLEQELAECQERRRETVMMAECLASERERLEAQAAAMRQALTTLVADGASCELYDPWEIIGPALATGAGQALLDRLHAAKAERDKLRQCVQALPWKDAWNEWHDRAQVPCCVGTLRRARAALEGKS